MFPYTRMLLTNHKFSFWLLPHAIVLAQKRHFDIITTIHPRQASLRSSFQDSCLSPFSISDSAFAKLEEHGWHGNDALKRQFGTFKNQTK